MNLLLSSNSKLGETNYLEFCKSEINAFLTKNKATNIIFIPFAAVNYSYDEYVQKVSNGLNNIEIKITGIHQFTDPNKAIKEADAILVGGGNSFQLLNEIYKRGIFKSIQEVVMKGTPYIGWSAGSNLACPSIKTTNDMPIVCPPSFDAFNFIPFQINPHYIHENLPNHNGETREDRISEFLVINPNITVVGLREGTLLVIEKNTVRYAGDLQARIFKFKTEFYELNPEDSFQFLLN